MSPKPSRAVAEARAAAIVEADDAQRARWRELEYFASPPWATRAGMEVAAGDEIDEFFGAGTVWEPACGDGIMAKVIAEKIGHKNVIATDIEPQGYGQRRDFLQGATEYGVRWVWTNPPFPLAAQFIERGLGIAKVGVAVLCRLPFLESAKRFDLHARHLTDVAVFSERVGMQLGPWNPECSTATAYAWFFYSKVGATWGRPRLHLIPPGTQARLTKPDDVRNFCKPKTGSLL